jgi:hypothetical protein
MAITTRRAAYRKWQSLNKRLAAASEELNHEYLALLHKAAGFLIDKEQGLLRLASAILCQPLDSETLRLQERLNYAFTFLGRGFCRRSPIPLQLDIFQYTDQVQKICSQLQKLSGKLSLARKILSILQQNRKIARHYLKRTLIDPEAVWITLLLRQRYRLTHQNLELYLHKSWQDKLAASQNWLKLLQSSLPAERLADLRHILQELQALHADGAAAIPWSPTALHQFDLCTDLAHHLSSEVISSQPDHIKHQ